MPVVDARGLAISHCEVQYAQPIRQCFDFQPGGSRRIR